MPLNRRGSVGPDHRELFFNLVGPVMARRGPTHRMGKPIETATEFRCHRCGWSGFYWEIEPGRQALLRHLWLHDGPPEARSNDRLPPPGPR